MPNEYSSAPSSAATITSRPVFSPPSTRSRTRDRRPLSAISRCASTSPSSHGSPAFLIDESGDAPVPPSAPAMCTTSASAFATPRRDRADPFLGDELHRDRGARVHLFQVEDQLCEILDRVDVVMRRGTDQRHARLRVTEPGDLVRHLVARQLAALTRFGALRDLDLELFRERAVLRGDAETRRGDLLDLRVLGGPVPRGPHRPPRCWTGRRSRSWRARASRAPPPRSTRARWRPSRSAPGCAPPARPRRAAPPSPRERAPGGRVSRSAGGRARSRRTARTARAAPAPSLARFNACAASISLVQRPDPSRRTRSSAAAPTWGPRSDATARTTAGSVA